MWPDLPLEFNIIGTPVSAQSSNSRAKREWKAKVSRAALLARGEELWAFDDLRLAITLFYFPQAPMLGDIDNIVKLTLDALRHHIYVDDSLVDRIVVQRFDPESSFAFAWQSDVLVEAMATNEPVLYVNVDKVPVENVL